jgi:hypothetical protein
MITFRSLNDLDPTEGTVTLIDCISPFFFFMLYSQFASRPCFEFEEKAKQ